MATSTFAKVRKDGLREYGRHTEKQKQAHSPDGVQVPERLNICVLSPRTQSIC